jgi:hypothetical protein
MLILDQSGSYYFRCDGCGKESDRYPTLAALERATHFGNTLYDEPPGWTAGRDQLPITADDALGSDQYKYSRGPISPGVHLCPSCRAIWGLYRP